MTNFALPSGIIVPATSELLEAISTVRSVGEIRLCDTPPTHEGIPSGLVTKTAIGLGIIAVPLLTPFLNGKAAASSEVVASPAFVPEPTLLEIVWAGDSLTVGREQAGDIVPKLLEKGITTTGIEAEVGLHASEAPKLLDKLAPQIATAEGVVLAVGTNPENNFADILLLDVVHAHNLSNVDNDPAVILLPELMGDNKVVDAVNRNAVIREVAQRATGMGVDVEVMPYYDYASQNLRLRDGIHPNNYQALTDYDATVIPPLLLARQPQTPATPPIDVPIEQPRMIELPDIRLPQTPVYEPAPPPPILPKATKPNSFLLDVSGIVGAQAQNLAPAPVTRQIARVTYVPQPQPVLLDINAVPAAKSAPEPDVAPPTLPPAEQTKPPATSQPDTGREVPMPLPKLLDLSSLPTPPPAQVFEPAPSPSSGETPPQKTPPQETGELEVNFTGLYTIDEHGRVNDEELKAYITSDTSIFKKAENLPGYVIVPKNINGMPYRFANGMREVNRAASPRAAALSVIIADKVKQMRERYPDLEDITFFDILGAHTEHKNGGDIDVGILKNFEARRELFLFLLSLRNPDGTAYVHHIITGDKRLKEAGDEFLAEHNFERPRVILQENHGVEPKGANHWHVSMDGDSDGPFDLDQPGGTINHIDVVIIDTPVVLPGPPGTDEAPDQPAPPTGILIDITGAPEPGAGDDEENPEDETPGESPSDEESDGEGQSDEDNEDSPSEDGAHDGDSDQEDDVEGSEDGAGPPNDDPVTTPPDSTVPVPPTTTPPPNEEPPQEAPPAETAPAHEGLRGETIPIQIFNYFVDNGLTEAGAYGVMGNFKRESGFDPSRAQDTWNGTCATPPDRLEPGSEHNRGPTRGYGFGLAQWTIEWRQNALQAFADAKGTSWQDLLTQLEYTVKELQETFPELYQVLTTSDDVYATAGMFVATFERPWQWSKKHGGNEHKQREEMRARGDAAARIKELFESGEATSIEVACSV